MLRGREPSVWAARGPGARGGAVRLARRSGEGGVAHPALLVRGWRGWAARGLGSMGGTTHPEVLARRAPRLRHGPGAVPAVGPAPYPTHPHRHPPRGPRVARLRDGLGPPSHARLPRPSRRALCPARGQAHRSHRSDRTPCPRRLDRLGACSPRPARRWPALTSPPWSARAAAGPPRPGRHHLARRGVTDAAGAPGRVVGHPAPTAAAAAALAAAAAAAPTAARPRPGAARG